MVAVAHDMDRKEINMQSSLWEPVFGIIFPNYCLGRALNFISEYALVVWDERAKIMCPQRKCSKY